MSGRGHLATDLALAPGSRCAVANYASRNPWIDLRELAQEASLAALEARRSWRPDGGTSHDLWEAWIVGQALSRFVAEARCPVSLPKRKGKPWLEATSSQRLSLIVRSSASGSCCYVDAPEIAQKSVEQHEPLEDFLDLERAISKLRGVLSSASQSAREVLLGEQKSAAVAERAGLSRREVYYQTELAMRALRAAFCSSSEEV